MRGRGYCCKLGNWRCPQQYRQLQVAILGCCDAWLACGLLLLLSHLALMALRLLQTETEKLYYSGTTYIDDSLAKHLHRQLSRGSVDV